MDIGIFQNAFLQYIIYIFRPIMQHKLQRVIDLVTSSKIYLYVLNALYIIVN